MAKLCGARCRCSPTQLATATAKGPEALAKLLRRGTCKRAVVPGRNRCYLHGGFSTGPRTAAGMSRMVAAATAGRAGKYGNRNPKQPSGRYTLQAKSARAATALRIRSLVDARHSLN